MADTQNQQSGGTIDLRQIGNQTGGASSATGTASAQDPFAKFEIPESVKKLYPDLIQLILETESMNDDERQYWFQILPIMTDQQVQKLRDILTNEKQQLNKLDQQYESEIKRINDKHVSQWKEFEAKEKRKKLHAEESKVQTTEEAHEEELLKKLEEM